MFIPRFSHVRGIFLAKSKIFFKLLVSFSFLHKLIKFLLLVNKS
jgi:hypothetical protein